MKQDDAVLRSAYAYEQALVRLCFNDVDQGCSDLSAPLTQPSWLSYRRMVRARFHETIEHAFERLAAQLGHETFCKLEGSFLEKRGPKELVLRHVPRDFLEFLVGGAARDKSPIFATIPAWAVDLARFEWAELEVAYAQDEVAIDLVGPLAMDRPLALSPTCRVLQFGHRVHELSRERPTETIRPGKVSLCIYRDRETFDVRVLELSQSAAELLSSPELSVRPLADLAKLSAERSGTTIDGGWLDAFAMLLADLSERGVVLGSHAKRATPRG